MDLIRNSGLNPVAHGLLVERQQRRDLRHRQELLHACNLTRAARVDSLVAAGRHSLYCAWTLKVQKGGRWGAIASTPVDAVR
jgi:hypothetical protein